MVSPESDFTDPTPMWFEPERHVIAMREAVETLIFTSNNGQKFSGLHLNRDFYGRPPIVTENAMFTASNQAEQKYAAYQHAVRFPDRSIYKIDLPAHGYTDPMTYTQHDEIIETGGLSLIAQAQAEAIRRKTPDAQEVITTGDSTGGRIALDFAQKANAIGMRTLLIVGFEPIG